MKPLQFVKDLARSFKERRMEYLAVRLIKEESDFVFALLRFMVYSFFMMVMEISFYSVIKLFQRIPVLNVFFQFEWVVDPRLNLNQIWSTPANLLFGQSSLYMILVYGCIALFWCEFVFRKTYKYSFIIRGVLYAAGISFFELVFGWLLFWLTGYKIWYYTDRWAVFQFTSFAIWGVWFFISLVFFEPIMLLIVSNTKKNQMLKEITHTINPQKFQAIDSMHFLIRIMKSELYRAMRHHKPFSLVQIHHQKADSGELLKQLDSAIREEDLLCSINPNTHLIIFTEAGENSLAYILKKIAQLLKNEQYTLQTISIPDRMRYQDLAMILERKCMPMLEAGKLNPDCFIEFINTSFQELVSS